jgi:acyl carrier protein
MLVGGEPLAGQLAERLLACGVGDLHNMYGPTETTIWSSTARLDDGDVTIGRPIANTRFYVLDDRLQPVPVGAIGELFIAGDGVARGYLNRAELTDQRFLRDPFRADGRMYRTGDRVRYRRDGVLTILGRADQQTKIRGHRVELGEIESHLERCEGVRQAVVVVRDAGSPGAVVVGHVVRGGAGREVTADDLQRRLRETLPEYMVPGHIRFHETLPATPNGKVDRKVLAEGGAAEVAASAAPAGGGAPRRPVAAPATLLASDDAFAEVLAIWQQVLHADRIGADDNFFDLGGHSLLTIKLQSLLQSRLGVVVPLVELFRFTTIRAQARRVRELRGTPGPAVAEPSASRGGDRAAKRRQALERRRV